MILPLILIAAAAAFAGGTAPICDPERLNCDNGTRSTGGSISRPSVSNNPGGLSGGGQVSPGKSPGKGGHKGHGKSKGKK